MSKILAGLMIFTALSLQGQAFGVINAVRGNVTIQRNGDLIPSEGIDIGMDVENLDFIRTARGASIEIGMDPRSGIAGRLTLLENSSVQLEISRMRTGQRGTIELLVGSISLNVNRLSGGSRLDVRTQSATMGVRGTKFDVITGPSGEVLVSTTEGRVVVTDPTGNEVASVPGAVVEAPAEGGGQLRVVPVSLTTLEEFRRDWMADRVEAFRANAPRAARNFAQRYTQLLQQFQNAFRTLEAQSAILEKWAAENRRGQMGGLQDSIRERRAIIGPLMHLRRILFFFERTYFRLIEVRQYLDAGALGQPIRAGFTLGQFFEAMDREAPHLLRQMGRVRMAAKFYAQRNEGELPIGGFGEDSMDSEAESFFE